MNTLAYKENKATKGSILMIFIILCLIGVVIFRLINFLKYGIMVRVILIGLLLVGLYYLVITIKDLIINIKRPQKLITLNNDTLYVYTTKVEKVLLKDIIKINKGTIYKDSMLTYQASIVIHTKDSLYIIHQIKDLDKAFNELQNALNLPHN